MSTEKSLLHLPAIGQSFRRRIRPPPTPSFTSRAAKAAHIAENVSALKAKYADYTNWLKTATRPNHEPVLTQELLKHSLCHMGIDTGKAEQVVSTCSWYVYQFEKDLKLDAEQLYCMDKKTTMLDKNKLKKTTTMPDNAEHSITTLHSLDHDDSSSLNKRNPHQYHLPPIALSDLSSARSRRVDFDAEQSKYSTPKTLSPKRIRLKPIPIDSSNSLSISSMNSSTSSRAFRRQGLAVLGQTRSILRKKDSLSSSTDISQSKSRSTPSSSMIDETPLGTRSQRLFGGSECFAQIMNELEEKQT